MLDRFLLAFCLFAVGQLGFAQTPPPPENQSYPIAVKASVATDFAEQLLVGKLRLQFEKTELEEIRANLGPVPYGMSGDASTSIRWLCYSLPEQLLWFGSGEMGGGRVLTRLRAVVVTADDPRLDECPEVPETFQPVRFAFGWLGTNVAAVRDALGRPSGVVDDQTVYFYSGKLNKSGIEYDVSTYASMKFSDCQLSEIDVSHITSN